MGTNTETHPFFVENGDSRRETAVLLTGTATEFGIDQHDIQATPGGFNITEALAKAVYGDDFDSGEDGESEVESKTESKTEADPDLAESLRGRPEGDVVSDEHLEAIGHDLDAENARESHEGGDEGDDEVLTGQVPVEDPDAREIVADDEIVPPYTEWSYPDLKAAAIARGLETADKRRETLEAALTADDEAVADDGDTE